MAPYLSFLARSRLTSSLVSSLGVNVFDAMELFYSCRAHTRREGFFHFYIQPRPCATQTDQPIAGCKRMRSNQPGNPGAGAHVRLREPVIKEEATHDLRNVGRG